MNIYDITKNHDYILFDFDGTLVDTGPGIINAVHYSLSTYGIDETDWKKLSRFVGPPLVDAFHEHYGFDHDKSVEAVFRFREYYLDKGYKESEIYPGILAMLEKLKSMGKHLVIATGKPEDLAIQIAQIEGIYDYFELIRGAYVDEQGEHLTHKTEIIESIFQDLNIKDTSKAIMVGDRANDIKGAHGVGIEAIGILWGGYGTREELEGAGADHLIETP